MRSKKIGATRRPDDESPEWSRKDFDQARPALPLVGEVFGADAAEAIFRGDGRPRELDRNRQRHREEAHRAS